MGYSKESNITASMQQEIDLLTSGLSYREIVAVTGCKTNSIKERNRLVYGIDIRQAFLKRIERDGIKQRNIVEPSFGYWFSGYFDGEGCLTVFYRERNGTHEKRVGVQISCRYDDADILRQIHENIGAGVFWDSKAKGATNKAVNWRVESVADLAEIMLPIFDTYPLRSKKRKEYAIWRTLVINQYINTLGGTSDRTGTSIEEVSAFKEAMQAIRKIRHSL